MRRVRDIDLMLLADGELSAEERADLERSLAEDPELDARARERLGGIEEVGEVVRGHLELTADEAEPRLDRMWNEIEKRIRLDEAETLNDRPAAPVAQPGLWSRFGKWLEGHRSHVLTGVLSAGAVAAIAFVLRPAEPSQPTIASGSAAPPPVTQPVKPPPASDDVVAAGFQPTEIEEVEVEGGEAAVFTFQGEDGEEETVIWVTPDDTLEGL